jgi:hypothetical protein
MKYMTEGYRIQGMNLEGQPRYRVGVEEKKSPLKVGKGWALAFHNKNGDPREGRCASTAGKIIDVSGDGASGQAKCKLCAFVGDVSL